MKKLIVTLLLSMVLINLNVLAQANRRESMPVFEEGTAREAYPNVAVFVFPQICDLEMLSKERVNYKPVSFALSKDLGSMSEAELQNDKTRALQKACEVSGADVIIEPLYTSIVYNGETKTIHISVSGYPAKYVNFRSLQPSDLDMIKALYPLGVERIQKYEDAIITTATEKK